MRSSRLLLFAVLAFATASSVSDSGKKAIGDARDKAEAELRCKLNGTDSSVLIQPIKALMEISSAGKKDQDDIATFSDKDQVEVQLNRSVVYWKQKIDEVIKPYVTNPKAYENMVIDFPYSPPDPTNNTKAYKEAELNITETVKKGIKELQTKFSAELKNTKAKNVKEVTCSSWARLQLGRIFNEEVDFLKINGQWAKYDSANGQIQAALATLKTEVENSKKEFSQLVNEISKQFQNCVRSIKT